MVKITNLIKKQDGAVIVLFALVITVLAGMAALVVDLGSVYAEKQKLQNAVDAAALAVATDIDSSGPTNTAAVTLAQPYINGIGFNSVTPTAEVSIANKTAMITASSTVYYTFAKVLGDTFISKLVTATATAKKSPGVAFDYTLFAGRGVIDQTTNSGKTKVAGDIYGMEGIDLAATIYGTPSSPYVARYVNTSGTPNTFPDGYQSEQLSAPIAMPDFPGLKTDVQSRAQDAEDDDSIIRVFSGNTTLEGSLSGPYYVDGNVTFKKTNASFSGDFCLYATGDITFDGSGQTVGNISEGICLISEKDITVNGVPGSSFQGIIFAPQGEVTLNGSGDGESPTLEGRVIADSIRLSGNKYVMVGSDNGMDNLPPHVRLIK